MKAKKTLFNIILSSLTAVFALFCFGCASASSVTKGFTAITSGVLDAAGYSDVADVVTATGNATSNALEKITPENEYYIGRAVAATVLTNYKTYTKEDLESYLNKICRTITENSSQSELYNGYHVKMLDSDEVNAFATSGGHIFVTRGMLKCVDSEDALAAVLAHEIAHIQLKHSLSAIKTSRWVTVGTSTLTAAASLDEEYSKDMGEIVTNIINSMVNNGYSQGQEFDADEKALYLMADAGYNPAAMDNLLSKMNELQGGRKTGFYKTHPSPEKRIKNVNKAIKNVAIPADTADARKARFASIMG